MTTNNQPLPKPLRSQLEATVKSARDVAEKGAHAALSQLAVGEASAPSYLTEELKALRRRLRAHGRALGDRLASDDTQALQHLVWEVAYEHWHRMLFARFLAENGLLLWEPGAAVSLDDCEALVQEADPAMNLGAKTQWELAAKLAARMLPQVFRPQSPVFELAFAPEHQRELERLLAALPPEVFKASDSLGWVYQFWQAKRKQEVNDSEVKIGADELPAVTQLFTEPYMVDFLLHNSLGAWWVTRHPDKPCPVPLTYLRRVPSPSPLGGEGRGEGETPAAGTFEGWPDRLEDFKLLDPCCGSGHFLVAAFLLLVPMRMAAEGLSAMDAVDAVLADNLHGLELDARCVEIAVFALALAAWRFPDENGDPLGVRADMPAPQVACCGLKVAAKPEDWMALVPEDLPGDPPRAAYLRQELRLLHASFAQAPLLGSLLDPARSLKNDLATSSFDTLRDLLGRALATERPATLWGQASELQDDSWDLALTAKGLLDAARLLDARFHLVVTNVPYLGRGRQDVPLRDYCELHYSDAKQDLANVFVERSLELCKNGGAVQVVTPQNWLTQPRFQSQRNSLLGRSDFRLVSLIGSGGFDGIGGEVVNVALLTLRNSFSKSSIRFVDVSELRGVLEKSSGLKSTALSEIQQEMCSKSTEAMISMVSASNLPKLGAYASALAGCITGDAEQYIKKIWEIEISDDWEFHQSSIEEDASFTGMQEAILWENEGGRLWRFAQSVKHLNHVAQNWLRGKPNWGRKGVVLNAMGRQYVTTYSGGIYNCNCCAIIPNKPELFLAVYCFAASGELERQVRSFSKSLTVNPKGLLSVPFDVDYWMSRAQELYPSGFPRPYSNDLTQWIFHGHPQPATDPLQVAVARLAGYRWPAETDTAMELADEARTWIARCEKLAEHTDDDGIVCLPSVRGEAPAHDRLLKLLITAWETVQPGSWKPAVLDKLLADADCAGKGLDVWLREKFFEQHAKRFQHRPFIWHVWDGLKDGFAALVNYHQLDHKKLERLIHTYLGDWIRQQEAGVRDRIDGAQQRLAAAQDLKRRLELILEGEPPYDIFVRWKKLSEQPIGWNPDLNDGVRLNIRPFMTAEVLRHNKKPKLNITWDKDRGKDVESAPWFKVFGGDRINDHHLTIAKKVAAREAKSD